MSDAYHITHVRSGVWSLCTCARKDLILISQKLRRRSGWNFAYGSEYDHIISFPTFHQCAVACANVRHYPAYQHLFNLFAHLPSSFTLKSGLNCFGHCYFFIILYALFSWTFYINLVFKNRFEFNYYECPGVISRDEWPAPTFDRPSMITRSHYQFLPITYCWQELET